MEDLSGLIIAARKGDNDAFEEVVRRFQDMAVVMLTRHWAIGRKRKTRRRRLSSLPGMA